MSKFCYAAALSLIVLMLQAHPAAAAPVDEYFDYLFSQAFDASQWKSGLEQCEKAYQRPLSIFKKGWQQKMDAATSKKVVEEMRVIIPLIDDPVLSKMACVALRIRLLLQQDRVEFVLSGGVLGPLMSNRADSVLPYANKGSDDNKSGRFAWGYPTEGLRAYREDLTDKTLENIRKEYHAQIERISSSSDVDYPEINHKMEFILAAVNFDPFPKRIDLSLESSRTSMPRGNSQRDDGNASIFHFYREIYWKLAHSQPHVAKDVKPESVETATPQPNQEPNPVVTEQKLTAPSHCNTNEATLFTGMFGKKILSFCATPAKMPYERIEYRYGIVGKVDMTYSVTTKGDSPKLFFDSVANDPRSSTDVVWFQKGTFIYAVLQCYGGTCESGGPSLVVFNGKKKLLESKCQGESECDFHFPVSGDGSGPKSLSPIILLKDAPSQLGL